MADIFFGQNTSFQLISRSHGAKKLKFVESFEVDPAHTNKRLYFFNSKEMFPITIFDGCSGRFGYLETEEKFFLSTIMDKDPNLKVINDDPATYLEFCVLLNSRNELGDQKNSILVKGARINGAPESIAPHEEQHSTISFIAKTRYKIKGGGIRYVRVLAATPDSAVYEQTDGSDLNFDSSGSVTLPFIAADTNIYDPKTTRRWMVAYKNGTDVTQAAIDDPTLFTVDFTAEVVGPPKVPASCKIVLPAAPAATDVWEFYLPYES